MNKTAHKESYYIDALLNNNRIIVKEIYDKFYPKIKRMVELNNGSPDDAKDVFQDALVEIYKKKKLKSDFVLTCPFYYFLYPICKNIWRRELKKKYRKEVTIKDPDGYIDEANIDDIIHQTERHALYKEKFALLSEKCQQLIQHVFSKKKMREIADLIGNKNEQTTKQGHYRCKKRLIELVTADDRFNELAN